MATFASLTARLNSGCLGAFGQTCTYTTPDLQDTFAVTLIIDKPRDGDPGYPGVYLKASGALSDFTIAPAKGGFVAIGSANYVVYNLTEDEAGMVHLWLNKC